MRAATTLMPVGVPFATALGRSGRRGTQRRLWNGGAGDGGREEDTTGGSVERRGKTGVDI